MTGSGLEELHIFIAVVREHGFTAAARHLDLPPSTVSRKVSHLLSAAGALDPKSSFDRSRTELLPAVRERSGPDCRQGLDIVNLSLSYVVLHSKAVNDHENTLEPVMPEWQGIDRKINIVYRSRDLLPQRVRLFIDYMCHRVSPRLNQE